METTSGYKLARTFTLCKTCLLILVVCLLVLVLNVVLLLWWSSTHCWPYSEEHGKWHNDVRPIGDVLTIPLRRCWWCVQIFSHSWSNRNPDQRTSQAVFSNVRYPSIQWLQTTKSLNKSPRSFHPKALEQTAQSSDTLIISSLRSLLIINNYYCRKWSFCQLQLNFENLQHHHAVSSVLRGQQDQTISVMDQWELGLSHWQITSDSLNLYTHYTCCFCCWWACLCFYFCFGCDCCFGENAFSSPASRCFRGRGALSPASMAWSPARASQHLRSSGSQPCPVAEDLRFKSSQKP